MNFDSGLPANTDAERAILGGILIENKLFDEACDLLLRPEHFVLDSHQRIFTCMGTLIGLGRLVDIWTLSEELYRRKEIESVGGVSYLSSLTTGILWRHSIRDYVRIVKDKAVLRQLIGTCSNTITRACDQSDDSAVSVVAACVSQLESLTLEHTGASDMQTVGQYLDSVDIFAEQEIGIQTGFKEYDAISRGLHPEELTIVAARTSIGKTAFAGSLVRNVARKGHTVAVFINEQRKKSFVARMLCGAAHVPLDSYFRNLMSPVEKSYFSDAVAEFKQLPIFWDDRNWMTVASIRAQARKVKRDDNLGVVIIDQLSHISAEGVANKGDRTDEMVGKKGLHIKRLAQELGVPIVLFHQLNRETLKNKDCRPTLANLRDSGNLEEHADNVDFLHRPEYYDRNDQSLKGKAEIIRAKGRDSATGVCHTLFEAPCASWSDQ